MRSIILPLKIFLVVALISTNAFAWPWGPQDYNECVLKESQKFQGPVPSGTVAAMHRVCRERFPYKSIPAPAEANACNPPPSTGPAAREWLQTITSAKFRLLPEFMRVRERDQFIERVIARNPQVDQSTIRSQLLTYTTPPRYVACE